MEVHIHPDIYRNGELLGSGRVLCTNVDTCNITTNLHQQFLNRTFYRITSLSVWKASMIMCHCTKLKVIMYVRVHVAHEHAYMYACVHTCALCMCTHIMYTRGNTHHS